MPNSTHCHASPPLPSHTLTPVPSLLPFTSDLHLSLFVPLATYWTLGFLFHWFDTAGYLKQYRNHTPVELEQRNRVSGLECLRGVLFNQLLQTLLGIAAGSGADADFYGDDAYQVAAWAARLQAVRRILPCVLAVLADDTNGLGKAIAMFEPSVGNLLTDCAPVDSFSTWELSIGKAIYYVVTPCFQFTIAVLISDSWQYFGHRWMHSNKFMYKHIHSRHHTLSVPYAYGSLYTHPLEGLLQDTLGVALAFYLTNMSTRQGMLFYFGSTVKDIYDHCGYALPWDTTTFHDLHQQSWGMKTNLSVYTSFWDRVLGTLWTDSEEAKRLYKRGSKTAGEGKRKGHMGKIGKAE